MTVLFHFICLYFYDNSKKERKRNYMRCMIIYNITSIIYMNRILIKFYMFSIMIKFNVEHHIFCIQNKSSYKMIKL